MSSTLVTLNTLRKFTASLVLQVKRSAIVLCKVKVKIDRKTCIHQKYMHHYNESPTDLSLIVGRHFCLKCSITTGSAEILQDQRSPQQRGRLHTLDTLASDYERFVTEGNGDISNAKLYNNVITQPVFGLPLDHVKVRCIACVFVAVVVVVES